MLDRLIAHRRIVQLVLGVGIFALVYLGHVSLLGLLAGGVALGVLFGKVFCRWMCPMGLLVEALLGMSRDGRTEQLYQYHKLGCPIAWVTGLLNRVSLLRIRFDPSSCKACGKCDKACYITALDREVSHYRLPLASPSDSYTCSRCLECVGACPTGSLRFGLSSRGAPRIPDAAAGSHRE